MTNNPSEDSNIDRSDSPDDRNSQHANGGVSGLLRQLLETIQRLDESGQSVKQGQGGQQSDTAFTYEYSVKLGLGDDEATGVATAEPDHPVSVQETLDGASVTVDLPAVDPESLQAGVTGRQLTVAADDDQLARITLPEDGYIIRTATYNNGILEIRLEDGDAGVVVDD